MKTFSIHAYYSIGGKEKEKTIRISRRIIIIKNSYRHFKLESYNDSELNLLGGMNMFYKKQPVQNQESYKNMLKTLGGLSRLFSEAESPYLFYRAHENIFAKFFDVSNNGRSDDSVDAYNIEKGIGIGLKTWVGGNDQKVAEFGRLRPQYEHLTGIELVKQIAEYRNLRIRTAMNSHGLDTMLYHIIKRIPNAMQIYEAAFDEIDVQNIVIDNKRGNDNNTYFSDGKHTYHFSSSKNTLYMIFDHMELVDEFEVEIYDDPYEILSTLLESTVIEVNTTPKKEQLCLRLYSTDKNGNKFVQEKSGINQWNANGRKRKLDEIYIPYPAKDRNRGRFFPERDTAFELRLPNGETMSAKVCQDNGKAIMSNPNSFLGKWLLRDVLNLTPGKVVTYDMLREFNIDCVVFTKFDDFTYSIDFGVLGTYEEFYGLEDSEKLMENKNDID